MKRISRGTTRTWFDEHFLETRYIAEPGRYARPLLRTFRAAKRHLNPGGVFVFDAHTEANLERLAEAPPHVLPFGDDYLIMNVGRERGEVYGWNIEVFEHVRDRQYLLHRQLIRERAFANDKVLDALGRIFPFARAYDPQGWSRPKQSSRRLFYVCRMPSHHGEQPARGAVLGQRGPAGHQHRHAL